MQVEERQALKLKEWIDESGWSTSQVLALTKTCDVLSMATAAYRPVLSKEQLLESAFQCWKEETFEEVQFEETFDVDFGDDELGNADSFSGVFAGAGSGGPLESAGSRGEEPEEVTRACPSVCLCYVTGCECCL